MQGYFEHPNIAKLLGFFADEARIYIVFEYCEYGTLEQYQKTLPGCRIEEKIAAKMVLDVASALLYLHDFNLMHRDLRPQSILVDQKLSAKLCDFAFAIYTFGPLNNEPRTTPAFEAPEFFLDLPVGRLADNWQLGCLIYEMLTGDCPFAAPQSVDPRDHIAVYPGVGTSVINLTVEAHRCSSKLAADLIRKLMMRDAELRLPLDQVIVHPWILLNTSYSPDKPKAPVPLMRTMKVHGVGKEQDQVFVEDCVGASQQIKVEAATKGGMQETRLLKPEYFESVRRERNRVHPCQEPKLAGQQ
jgi:aurora kinase A